MGLVPERNRPILNGQVWLTFVLAQRSCVESSTSAATPKFANGEIYPSPLSGSAMTTLRRESLNFRLVQISSLTALPHRSLAMPKLDELLRERTAEENPAAPEARRADR